MNANNLILRTVYLSPELDNRLRVEAFAKRISKSELIRKYIDLGMKAAGVEPLASKAPGARSTEALPGSIVARSKQAQAVSVAKSSKRSAAIKSGAKKV
jgi:hypothetical protein